MYCKYTLAPVYLIDELFLAIETIMAHADASVQPQKYYNSFPVLVIVCGFLANALSIKMVGSRNNIYINKSMWFLAVQLAIVKFFVLGE